MTENIDFNHEQINKTNINNSNFEVWIFTIKNTLNLLFNSYYEVLSVINREAKAS